MSSVAISIKPIKLWYGFYVAHLEIWARDNYFIMSEIIRHPSVSYFHQYYVIIVTLNITRHRIIRARQSIKYAEPYSIPLSEGLQDSKVWKIHQVFQCFFSKCFQIHKILNFIPFFIKSLRYKHRF